MGRKRIFKVMILLFLIAAIFAGGVYLVSFLLGAPNLNNDQNTVFYSDNGDVIGEEKGTENRYWVDLEEMSPLIIEATIAIEDRRFYKHKGLDFKRIAGAALADIKNMSLKEGASTLTQQYARNLYLSQEKTWTRKLKEAFYAIRIEMFYSKDEILEGYLNTIYYGHGAYGIEAASKYFFNKSAASLTLAEAAMLAGVPKGPAYYSPLNDKARATKRQHRILKIMLDEKIITEKEYVSAMQEELVYTRSVEQTNGSIGPYFQDTALREAANLLKLDEESVRSGGFQLYTTLNVAKQKELEANIEQTINPKSEVEAGAMAMDPESGAVLALVGGRNYEKSPFNRAYDAKRMPGSSFKPFLYYAALEKGYNAGTMINSGPTSFTLANGESYEPRNYNGYYANEPITLAQALALSDNIYAVKTHLYLGTKTLVNTAKKFGFTSEIPAVPSLALGTASVSVREMIHGYGMLANGGHEITTHTITKIIDRDGKEVFLRRNGPGKEVLDPRKTFILTDLMTGMFDKELNGYMAVTGSSIADRLTRVYAGKSGTTNTDSWMIGFSPSLVAAIWIGYDDNRPMDIVPEVAYAKDIWAGFMEAAHDGTEVSHFAVPNGVIGVPVDPATGSRATPYCPTSRVMYFEKGDEPKQYCKEHFHDGLNRDEKGFFEKWFEVFF